MSSWWVDFSWLSKTLSRDPPMIPIGVAGNVGPSAVIVAPLVVPTLKYSSFCEGAVPVAMDVNDAQAFSWLVPVDERDWKFWKTQPPVMVDESSSSHPLMLPWMVTVAGV